MGTSTGTNREDRYVWIVAAFALAAALFVTLVIPHMQGGSSQGGGDPYGYGKIAYGFLEHGFDKVTRRSASLYPTFLSFVYAAGLTNSAVHIIQCFLHAATCAMVFSMGQRAFNSRTGLIAGLFCAVHPMLLRYVPDLHMEAWLTFFFTLTAWRAFKFLQDPSILNGLLLGFVGTIAILSKGVMLPVLGMYIVAWCWRWWRKAPGAARSLPGIVAVALTTSLMIAPWTYRNYAVSHKFVLLTPGTPDAFLRGYIFTRVEFATLQQPPYTVAENESNALFKQIAKDAGTTWELDEMVDDHNNGKVMKRWIVERPFDTLRKFLVGILTFWYEMTSLKNSLVPFSLAVINWIFAVIGIKQARRTGQPYWLFLLPVVTSNLFVAMLIPLGRYSVPILPSLAILAAFGVDTLLERRRLEKREAQLTAVQS
jgi:4-amino-4-deoxy-L-arabinose transferase-like glycosyltransferase